MNRTYHYIGLVACVAIIVSCFLPWVHYNNINETFTGFHVTRFPAGNYYGRAGLIITILTSMIFILMLIPKLAAKRINLFLSALLFAYCIRTYVIFTGSLFPEEIEKKIGIYLILFLPFLILITSVFPRKDHTA